MKNKGVYTDWFIDELVNEEDKERAMDGSLKSTEKVEFKCDNVHIYEQVILHHIKLSTGEKKQGCPVCGNVKNHKISTVNL